MASTYTISSGTGRVLIPQDNTNTLDGCQVISDSALDSTIILKLQQSTSNPISNDSNHLLEGLYQFQPGTGLDEIHQCVQNFLLFYFRH